MPLWLRSKVLWRNLTRRRQVEDDLDEEIRSYQAMLEDEKASAGADPRTARREALIELGGAEQIKEEVRDVRLGATLDSIGAELRQSLRGLCRNPGLTVLGIGMLSLGMGAGIVVASILYSAILRPLPFRDAARLVQIYETRLDRGINIAGFTEANFWDVRAQNRSFEEVGAYNGDEFNFTGSGPAEKVHGAYVTAGFFRALGVSPVVGRDFTYEEGRDGFENHTALLGNRYWRARFGADPGVVGRTLQLDGRPYTVVGVLPPGEPWLDAQVFIPFGYRASANRSSWAYGVVARLKSGVSPDAARADLQQIATGLAQTYPRDDKGIGFRVNSSDEWIADDKTRRALWVLMGAVAFLLLIACVNVANLLLARGTARQREIAVRTALGAGRGRLVRFVMMESLLLSGFGVVFGLGLAYGALRILQAMEIPGIPRLQEADLSPWVLGFSVSISLLTGVLAGLAPAMQMPSARIATALRDGDRQAGSRRQGRLRAMLVTGEVALSFLLLVGAGLLIRSFTQLTAVERGFQTERRLVFSVNMPFSYARNGAGKQFLDRFFERLAAMPDVIAAGAVSHRPVEGSDPGMGIDAVSSRQPRAPWAGWRVVSPGYFRAVGLPLLRGRVFDETDRPVWAEQGQPPPQRRVVISDRLAKLIFPDQDPVGKRVVLWKGQSGGEAEVVGVVGDSRERGLTSDPSLTVYLPYGRNALVGEFIVHTRGNPMALAPAVRSIVASLDPNLPIADVRSFEEVVFRSIAPQRFNAVLLAVFSGLALLLASAGIYGVLSYSIGRRTPEIGLRVALGASSASILRMTIVQGMRPVLAGLVLGVAGAAWLSRYFSTLLFGVKPLDALTFAAVAMLLLVTALLACYFPGRRAMRTDPAVALRIE